MSGLSKDDIKQLIELRNENKNLDYKESINWDSSSHDAKLNLTKDIIAISNTTDGGRIVFGVRDSDFNFVGMKKSDYESFDQTRVNDLLQKYSDPTTFCRIYKQIIEKKFVVVIDIPEFSEALIICKKDAHSSEISKKEILRKGDIYIRTDKGTSEKISSVQDMRDLLGRSLLKKGDELLHNIELLIKGTPIKKDSESFYFEYKKELKDARAYLEKVLGENLNKYGYWEIVALPKNYKKNRVENQIEVGNIIDKAEVNLRGWNFPHTDKHGNSSNFLKGRQSYTIWERHIEGYRIYQSGLMVFRKIIPEDIEGLKNENRTVMSFVGLIYFVTEVILFLKRLYEIIALDDEIKIYIRIKGTEERQLISNDPFISLWDYISKTNEIKTTEGVKSIELKSNYKKIAKSVIKKFFILFNWDDANEEMIDNWQTKLIERKY